MKYEDILSKKFLEYLKSLKKDLEVLNKEEKFFLELKKSLEKKSSK